MVDRAARTPRTSGSYSAFLDAAREMADKLASFEDPVAIAMRTKATALAVSFASWPTEPPDVERRSSDIQALIDLNGQVNEFLNRG